MDEISLFKMKLSEFEMLSNTIIKMYEKNSPIEMIDDLRRDVSQKLKEINEIYKALTEKDDVVYENYPNEDVESENKVTPMNKFKTNDFSVDLSTIGISKNVVKSVYYVDYRDDGNDKVSVVVYDHLVDSNTPLMKRLTEVMDGKRKFNFTVSHSRNDGYVEKYEDAYISKIFRGDLYDGAYDFVTVTIEISYDKVSYETANQAESDK